MVNRYSDVESFFKTYLDVDNDRGVFDRISNFRLTWATKKIDSTTSNLDFLSGMTLGVQAVRFSSRDEEILGNEALRMNLIAIQQDLYRVKGIVRNWKVSSNIINQTMIYLIRYILINNLDTRYIYECYYIMAYKMITSMISRRFSSHTSDPRIAALVVEEMSDKFILKELGSWQKYFEYRASFLMPGTKHAERLIKNYNTTTAIIIINDIQTNLRSTMQRIYSLLVEIGNSDMKIDTVKLERLEGEEVVLNNIKSYTSYTDIALRRMNGDFVDDNAIYLISEVSSNLNQSLFKTLLTNIEADSLESFEEINDIVRETLKTSIQYLMRTNNLNKMETTTLEMIKILKHFYSSSTVKDEAVVRLKELSLALVKKNTTVKTSWILTAMNINLLLYIVLIAVMKK